MRPQTQWLDKDFNTYPRNGLIPTESMYLQPIVSYLNILISGGSRSKENEWRRLGFASKKWPRDVAINARYKGIRSYHTSKRLHAHRICSFISAIVPCPETPGRLWKLEGTSPNRCWKFDGNYFVKFRTFRHDTLKSILTTQNVKLFPQIKELFDWSNSFLLLNQMSARETIFVPVFCLNIFFVEAFLLYRENHFKVEIMRFV